MQNLIQNESSIADKGHYIFNLQCSLLWLSQRQIVFLGPLERRVHFLLFSFFFLSTFFFLKKEKPSFFDVKPSFFLNWNSTATFFFYVHFLLFSFFMYISFFFSYIPFFFASLPLFFCVFPGLSLQWGLIVLLSTY